MERLLQPDRADLLQQRECAPPRHRHPRGRSGRHRSAAFLRRRCLRAPPADGRGRRQGCRGRTAPSRISRRGSPCRAPSGSRPASPPACRRRAARHRAASDRPSCSRAVRRPAHCASCRARPTAPSRCRTMCARPAAGPCIPVRRRRRARAMSAATSTLLAEHHGLAPACRRRATSARRRPRSRSAARPRIRPSQSTPSAATRTSSASWLPSPISSTTGMER